jgi:hypothetical protein
MLNLHLVQIPGNLKKESRGLAMFQTPAYGDKTDNTLTPHMGVELYGQVDIAEW